MRTIIQRLDFSCVQNAGGQGGILYDSTQDIEFVLVDLAIIGGVQGTYMSAAEPQRLSTPDCIVARVGLPITRNINKVVMKVRGVYMLQHGQ